MIRVLSLFDGIACAYQALKVAGWDVDTYYASEIDKYAIKIAMKNHPDIIEVGSVTELKGENFNDIDLLIGGSPCQDLSIANKDRKGLEGSRSGLFWEYVRLMNEVKPKYFVLENVNSMPAKAKGIITRTLQVNPIMIDAAKVSAQSRERLFWTNIPNVEQPKDRKIMLSDILEDGISEINKSIALDACYGKCGKNPIVYTKHQNQFQRRFMVQLPRGNNPGGLRAVDGKTPCLSGSSWEHNNFVVGAAMRTRTISKELELRNDCKCNSLTSVRTDSMVKDNIQVRALTPIECERLQSLPDNYTEGVSKTQRYKCLGNAFNVEVVAHILRNMFQEPIQTELFE